MIKRHAKAISRLENICKTALWYKDVIDDVDRALHMVKHNMPEQPKWSDGLLELMAYRKKNMKKSPIKTEEVITDSE